MKIFAVILLAILLTSCVQKTVSVPTVSTGEIAIEKQLQYKLAAQNGIKNMARLAARRARQTKRLTNVALRILEGGIDLCTSILNRESKPCLYSFKLMTKGQMKNEAGGSEDIIQAYADGATIYVSPHMMDIANTDEELAIVIGHEFAHNLLSHTKIIKKNVKIAGTINKLLDSITRKNGFRTNLNYKKSGEKAASISHSVLFEKEADYIGLYVTSLAGYDINGASSFWRKMATLGPDGIFFSTTHPSDPERFIMLEKTAIEINEKKKAGIPLFPEPFI